MEGRLDVHVLVSVWLLLGFAALMNDCMANESPKSMIYEYERGEPFYCFLGTLEMVYAQSTDIQDKCYERHKDKDFILPDSTKRYALFKYGTKGGFALNCSAGILHATLAPECNCLVHSSCAFTCDPGYGNMTEMVTCDLVGSKENSSVTWNPSEPCSPEEVSSVGRNNLTETSNTSSPATLPSLPDETTNTGAAVKWIYIFVGCVVVACLLVLAVLYKRGCLQKKDESGPSSAASSRDNVKTNQMELKCLNQERGSQPILLNIEVKESLEQPHTEELEVKVPREQPAVIASPEQPAVIASPEQPAVIVSPEQPAVIASPEQPAIIASPEQPAVIASPEQQADHQPSGAQEQTVAQQSIFGLGKPGFKDTPGNLNCGSLPSNPSLNARSTNIVGISDFHLSGADSLHGIFGKGESIRASLLHQDFCHGPAYSRGICGAASPADDEVTRPLLDKDGSKDACLTHILGDSLWEGDEFLQKPWQKEDCPDGHKIANHQKVSASSIPEMKSSQLESQYHSVQRLQDAAGSQYQILVEEMEPSEFRHPNTTLEGYVTVSPEQMQRLGFRDLRHFQGRKNKYRTAPKEYFSKEILQMMAEHGDSIPNVFNFFKRHNREICAIILDLHPDCEFCNLHLES